MGKASYIYLLFFPTTIMPDADTSQVQRAIQLEYYLRSLEIGLQYSGK